MWDGATGDHLFELVGHTGLATDVVFSIDGRLIVTTGDDGTARIWDATTGEQLRVLRTDDGQLNPTLSDDGSRLAAIAGDGLIRVWALDLDALVDIAQGRVTRSLSDAECREYLHLDACPTT